MSPAFKKNYFYDLPQDIQNKITDIKNDLILQDQNNKKRLKDKLHYFQFCDNYSDDLTDEMLEMKDVATILDMLVNYYVIYDYCYHPNCYTKDFILDKLNEAYEDGDLYYIKKEKIIDMVFTYFTKEEVVFILRNEISYV